MVSNTMRTSAGSAIQRVRYGSTMGSHFISSAYDAGPESGTHKGRIKGSLVTGSTVSVPGIHQMAAPAAVQSLPYPVNNCRTFPQPRYSDSGIFMSENILSKHSIEIYTRGNICGFPTNKCGMQVHKKLIIYCNKLIFIDLYLWIKIGQFNAKPEKISV